MLVNNGQSNIVSISKSVNSNDVFDNDARKRFMIAPRQPEDIANFKTWSFGTVNIRSGKEKDEGAKIYAVAKEANRAGLLFCCLQEVKYRNNGSKLIQLDTGESFEYHWCGQKQRREAGVGILIKVHSAIEINSPDINNYRIMAINLKIYGFNIRVVNGYSPTETGGSDSQKDVFYRNLKAACAKTHKHQKLITVGDFNATTHVATYKSGYDGNKIIEDPNCNENGRRLKSFCRSHRLSISSTFFHYPMINRYTWYSPDKKTKKINDYVLVESFVQKYVTDCHAEPDLDFDSDHRLLKTTLCTPCTRKARRTQKEAPKKPQPDIKTLNDPATHKRFIEAINDKLNSNSICPSNSSELSENILEILHSVASKVLPPRSRTTSDRQLWKTDEELNKLIEERAKLTIGTPPHKIVTKQIKRRVNWLRNEKLRIEADEINIYANNRQIEELFRGIKSDSSTFKTTSRKNGCEPNKLKQYFMEHFNQEIHENEPIELTEAPEFIENLQQIGIDGIKTQPPDFNEIRNTLKRLKNGKAANDIPAEYLRFAERSDEFVKEMVKLYRTIWETHNIPKSWSHSKLVALWKGSEKGSIKDPTAYRGLQIGSTMCKIMVIIIINRLNKWYDTQLLDQQQGFRAGRGTADGIYTVKRIQQITDKMKKPAYVLFVDLSAAFDHVVRKWLFKSIYQRFSPGADTKLIKLLETLYSFTTTSLTETPDDLFELKLGVRQGGPESPPLYNLYMDYVMRIYMNLCKYRNIKFLKLRYRIPSTATTREERRNKTDYGQHDVDWTGYADDLGLQFENADNLQKGLNALDDTFKRYHLTINVTKTKTMIVNYDHLNNDCTTYPKTICTLRNTPVENVTRFRYLGDEIKFDEPATGDAEVELRIEVAENKFYELSKKFLNQKIHLKTRVKILNSIVRSRLTYSCQTWNLTARQENRMNSAYTGMLRKMVKGGYRRKSDTEWGFILTNNDLLNICGTENISEFTGRQQKKYLAHLARQHNGTITKQLLFNDDEGRKPGPQSTVEKNVLEREQITANEFYRKALNREI